MTDIVPSMPEPSNNFPRSTSIASQISSSRESLHHSAQMSELPVTEPPPLRLTRKRAASLNTEAANQRFGQLGLSSATYPNQPPTAREQVCLCQPDPKIPRPRNGACCFLITRRGQVFASMWSLSDSHMMR